MNQKEEIMWTSPKSVEEWALFLRLVEEINVMYNFARERGIEPPLAVIEGIPKLLTFSEPETLIKSIPSQQTESSTNSAPKAT